MINNKKISKFAISIVKELQEKNFQAYLVGGCVRDLLCGLEPKDFDIATNATPEQVRKIFKVYEKSLVFAENRYNTTDSIFRITEFFSSIFFSYLVTFQYVSGYIKT